MKTVCLTTFALIVLAGGIWFARVALVTSWWHAPTGVECLSYSGAHIVNIQPGQSCTNSYGSSESYDKLLSAARQKYDGLSWLVSGAFGALIVFVGWLYISAALKKLTLKRKQARAADARTESR